VKAPSAPTLPPDTQTTLPVPVAFPGMPSTRWWTFEDRRVNFGDVRPDTTDLGKLLLIEFALVFANDWFLIPYQVPVGSLTRLVGLAVTNVFGERIFVEAAGRGPDDGWQRWAMYGLATAGDGPGDADTSLLVLPTATTVQEGKPLEEVLLIRDEVANMVWGVERTIPLPSGIGKPGGEAARELRAWHEAHAGPAKPAAPTLANEARIAYETMSSVPEHWIPFLPVQVVDDNREVQLQRGSMPRILRDGTAGKVKPRTDLLRPGLDVAPPPHTTCTRRRCRAPACGLRRPSSGRAGATAASISGSACASGRAAARARVASPSTGSSTGCRRSLEACPAGAATLGSLAHRSLEQRLVVPSVGSLDIWVSRKRRRLRSRRACRFWSKEHRPSDSVAIVLILGASSKRSAATRAVPKSLT
jgi:hypothetical protein